MDGLLQGSRWKVLKEVSERENTASEIAQRLEASLPNVSQQLKLLEAYDLIERGAKEHGSVGKPRQQYRLKKPVCRISFARRGFAGARTFTPQGFQLTLVQLLFLPREEQLCMVKMLCLNEGLLDCAVAFLKRTDTKVEVLLVTDDTEPIRKAYSSMSVESEGKRYDIAAWTHSAKEIAEGIASADAHFKELAKLAIPIHDPHNAFAKVNL